MVRSLDPAWASCGLGVQGLYDPPKKLTPVAVAAGPTTPAGSISSPTTAAQPSGGGGSVPASTTASIPHQSQQTTPVQSPNTGGSSQPTNPTEDPGTGVPATSGGDPAKSSPDASAVVSPTSDDNVPATGRTTVPATSAGDPAVNSPNVPVTVSSTPENNVPASTQPPGQGTTIPAAGTQAPVTPGDSSQSLQNDNPALSRETVSNAATPQGDPGSSGSPDASPTNAAEVLSNAAQTYEASTLIASPYLSLPGGPAHTLGQGSSGALIDGTVTLPKGSATNVGGVSYTNDGNGIVAASGGYTTSVALSHPSSATAPGFPVVITFDGSTYTMDAFTTQATNINPNAQGQLVTANGATFTVIPAASGHGPVIAGPHLTTTVGALATVAINGVTFTAGQGGEVAVGGTTYAASDPSRSTVDTSAQSQLVTANGAIYTVLRSTSGQGPVIVGPHLTTTLGASATLTIHGATFAAGQGGGVVIGGTTYGDPTTSRPATGSAIIVDEAAVFTVDGQTFTASEAPGQSNNAVIQDVTLSAGGPEATISGEVLSLGSAGVVVGGSTTFELSAASSGSSSAGASAGAAGTTSSASSSPSSTASESGGSRTARLALEYPGLIMLTLSMLFLCG